jgi:hypothetical protein
MKEAESDVKEERHNLGEELNKEKDGEQILNEMKLKQQIKKRSNFVSLIHKRGIPFLFSSLGNQT